MTPNDMNELAFYQARFPTVQWERPARIETPSAGGWACRICIARNGREPEAVPDLPNNYDSVLEHIEREHNQ